MRKTIIRYGIYSTLLLVALGMIQLLVIDKLTGFAGSEVAGYLSMLLAMIFVFLGIRHYRDKENGGSLTFGQGLKIGLLIVLIPSLFFGLFDILYTEVFNPGWMNEYYTHYMDQIRKTVPADKLDAALTKAKREMEFFSNPVLQFLVMSATVFIIGIIASIISALALRRNTATA